MAFLNQLCVRFRVRIAWKLALAAFFVALSSLPSDAQIFETQVEQTTGYDGAFAQVRLWLPKGSHPRRVIALIWGGNQCSLNAVNDPGWRALAKSSGSALLTCYFAPQFADNQWDDASGGSGSALLEALKELSVRSGQSQLADVGLYLAGDSQGGQFAFHFAAWCPDRTLGFVSIKGGRHQAASVPSAVKVPGLFFLGQKDLPFRIINVVQTFTQGRSLGAPWCLAVDPGAKHEPGSCGPLVKAFIEALSKLPQGNASLVVPFASWDQGGSKFHLDYPASWFPSADFGRSFTRFESGGLVADPGSLSFKSDAPARIADAVPGSVDLGPINSGDKSTLLRLKIEPHAPGANYNVTVLNRSYLSGIKVDGPLPDGTSISAQLDTTGLPLGRFSGILPLRFEVGREKVLGAINVPLTALIVGDIQGTPSLVDLVSIQPQTRTLVKIEIASKTNLPIKFVSCDAPSGVELESASSPANPLELTFAFNFSREELGNSASGSILLHLNSSKEWTLRVPFVASFK